MKGHEYISEAVRLYLQTVVPDLLRAHLADNPGMAGPDPADVRFVCMDDLSMVSDFPVVLVRSTDMPRMEAVGGDGGDYRCRYDIEVLVAADNRVHGDYELACAYRSRLLLAVRKAMLTCRHLPDDIDLPSRSLTEQTGAAAELLSGTPLAAGVLKTHAIVDESLTPTDPPIVSASHVSVSAAAADSTI